MSDTRSGKNDLSGPKIAELVQAAGHRAVGGTRVPDEVEAIGAAVRAALADPACDVVVLTGGTGFSPRDVTVEAVWPLFERPIEGFGELFRSLSFAEIGSAAMLSRATAGLVGGKAIFALPGSPAAVTLALRHLVLREVGHLLGQARRRS